MTSAMQKNKKRKNRKTKKNPALLPGPCTRRLPQSKNHQPHAEEHHAILPYTKKKNFPSFPRRSSIDRRRVSFVLSKADTLDFGF